MPVDTSIDDFLAAAMRRQKLPWPASCVGAHRHSDFLRRARYHGVTGLIRSASDSWPETIKRKLRWRNYLDAAWELRHREFLKSLFNEMTKRGIRCVVLKGTALAYGVYSQASLRPRADSDILIDSSDLSSAQQALLATGFSISEDTGPERLQESWHVTIENETHTIDLHMAAFNSSYLAPILTVEECFRRSVPLPRLAEGALMLAPTDCLIHVCIHRNMHRTAPYFSDGEMMVNADRLIWANDIALISDTFSEEDWHEFIALAHRKAVAGAMLEALEFSERRAGFKLPTQVRTALKAGSAGEPRSAYLLQAGRRSRVAANFWAQKGWRRRLTYLKSIAVPTEQALRDRFPEHRGGRAGLWVKRMVEFLLGRA